MALPEFEVFLHDATASLAADPEVQLEQRQELAARLDQLRAAHLAAGLAPAAATAAALAELGEAAALAATLGATHRARLARRARLRRWLRWVLVPAALLVALWPTAAILLHRPGNLLPLLAVLAPNIDRAFEHYQALLAEAHQHYPPAAQWLLRGDPSRPTVAQQQRAQWERAPADRVLLGNYITFLASEQEYGGEDALPPAAYLAELATAEAADPGNARYAYLAAWAWLKASGKLVERKGPLDGEGRPTYIKDLEVSDRDAFDRGLAEFRRGLAMPRYERYIAAMLRRQLDALPEPHDRLSALARYWATQAVLRPNGADLPALASVASTHGRNLLTAGQVDAARPLLDAGLILARQVSADSCFATDAYTVFDLAALGEPAAKAYAAAGLAEEAAARQAMAARVRQIGHDEWAGDIRSLHRYRHTGIVMGYLMLARYGLAPRLEELHHDRLTDYIELDRLALEVTILALAAAMVVALLAAVRWHRPPEGDACPLLLLPRWQQAARVLALGIGVPLAAYLAVTLTPLGGRSLGLHEAWSRTMLLALLLVAAIVIVTLAASRRLIHHRCQELGLAVPPPGSRWWRTSLLLLAALVVTAALLPPENLDLSSVDLKDAASALADLLDELGLEKIQQVMLPAVAALLGLAALVAAVSLLAGPRRFGRYTGTLARSLLPLLAGAILLLGLLRPVGAARESWLVRHDPLFSSSRETIGFTALESPAPQRLKAALAEALAP